MTIGESLALSTATKATETLGAKIAEAAIAVSSRVFDRAKISLEIGLVPYLEKTYARCRFYKTILDPFQPCDLEETYIHVKLECKSSTVTSLTDTQIFHQFLDGKRFMVTGLAGCGKSMLMKYFALRTFDSSRSIPLFIELRKLNKRANKDVISFIFNECSPAESSLTLAQFRIALKSGLFALILDGFDEVEFDHRREVTEQIQTLNADYGRCPIIVSSRPDRDLFSTWDNFQIFEVEKFDRRQTISLVELSKYEEGVKGRFLEALEAKLIKTHESFLRSPLLTIIMLLTFEEFAEIPNKMHAFYARAFDTLFQKHDADKDQFVRKIRSGLSREDFRLVLSSFCAFSYSDEAFTFSKSEFEEYISNGVRYSKFVNPGISVDASDFIADMKDAVCLIQEDGLNFVFVHRSFQEYFTAVFINKVESGKIKFLIDKMASRFNDNVIPMALDMAREKVEVNWVLPTIRRFIEIFDPKNGKRNSADVVKGVLGDLSFHFDGRTEHGGERGGKRLVPVGFRALPTHSIGPLEVLGGQYCEKLGLTRAFRPLFTVTFEHLDKLTANSKNARKKNFKKFLDFANAASKSGGIQILQIDLSPADSWWLDELGVANNFDEIHRILVELEIEVAQRASKRNDLISELIG